MAVTKTVCFVILWQVTDFLHISVTHLLLRNATEARLKWAQNTAEISECSYNLLFVQGVLDWCNYHYRMSSYMWVFSDIMVTYKSDSMVHSVFWLLGNWKGLTPNVSHHWLMATITNGRHFCFGPSDHHTLMSRNFYLFIFELLTIRKMNEDHKCHKYCN